MLAYQEMFVGHPDVTALVQSMGLLQQALELNRWYLDQLMKGDLHQWVGFQLGPLYAKC